MYVKRKTSISHELMKNPVCFLSFWKQDTEAITASLTNVFSKQKWIIIGGAQEPQDPHILSINGREQYLAG